MDFTIQKQIDELVLELKDAGSTFNDPVAKLMVTALLHQAQKVKDEVARLPARITDRLCAYFVPKDKIDANPSLCLVQPTVKAKREIVPHIVADGAHFSYKINNKQSLSYYPVFKSCILPVSRFYLLTPKGLHTEKGITKTQFDKKGQVWLGMEVLSEIETLENVSFFLKGTNGVRPQRIVVNNGETDLTFVSGASVEDIPMAEPFDSQQVSSKFLGVFSSWRRVMNGGEANRLIFINDAFRSRDAFKCRAYPKFFQQCLESDDMNQFENNILWILFDFGSDYEVPAGLEIIPNVIPVANVNVRNVTLTQSSPIAKLTPNDGSYFLSVMETPLPQQRQGFSPIKEEFVIRDFDTSVYQADALYADVRNLYNRFIDDYYAFIGYHGLKDGEAIRSLREMMNRIGKSVLSREDEGKFEEGTYAMRHVNLSTEISSVKISYLTTAGRLGNQPKAGELLENRKDAALEKDVRVITSADCGEDKATPDQMYEMLRYYTMTADRLYTKMDVDAFLRFQLLKEFGKDEMRRISYHISVQGAGGGEKLRRGLYVSISFKDEKNFQKARALSLDVKLRELIEDKSCISMPILVSLHTVDTI